MKTEITRPYLAECLKQWEREVLFCEKGTSPSGITIMPRKWPKDAPSVNEMATVVINELVGGRLTDHDAVEILASINGAEKDRIEIVRNSDGVPRGYVLKEQ